MKTNILSLLAIAGLFTFAGCANDDTTNNNNEQEPGTEGLTSFVEEDQATRTTGEYDGSGLNFFWTAGDRLWVNTGTATSPVLTQDSQNNINSTLVNNPTNPSAVKRVDKAKFYFAGTFTASSYPVRYTGKNGAKDKVTIKAAQSQTVPNDASHIGEDGDFGVATATKPVGSGKYHFTLDHKAAYITFMPYTTQSVIASATVQKIRIFTGNTSDALTGTFDLADDGTLSNPATTSNSVELTVPDFSLPNAFSYTANGATMVVNPGTYSNVSIEYTIHDPVTNLTGTITKTYPSVTFAAGKNKKVKTDLQVRVYPGNDYYMWDAQQNYWTGYEWDGANPTQPTTNGATNSADAPQSNVYTSGHTPRDYNDIRGYNDPTGTAPSVQPTTTRFKALPNVNEIYWYVQHGDPHWDNTELWATMGHLYVGGMWFKKLSAIAAAQSPSKTVADLKAASPDGVDYTRTKSQAVYSNSSVTTGRPSNLNDYFYLPTLGYYAFGKFYDFNIQGVYWSSTPGPAIGTSAYSILFNSSHVGINPGGRYGGFPMWKGQ